MNRVNKIVLCAFFGIFVFSVLGCSIWPSSLDSGESITIYSNRLRFKGQTFSFRNSKKICIYGDDMPVMLAFNNFSDLQLAFKTYSITFTVSSNVAETRIITEECNNFKKIKLLLPAISLPIRLNMGNEALTFYDARGSVFLLLERFSSDEMFNLYSQSLDEIILYSNWYYW